MDWSIQLGILLIIALVLVVVFIEPWTKQRRSKKIDSLNHDLNEIGFDQQKVGPSCDVDFSEDNRTVVIASPKQDNRHHNIVALSVFAKHQANFASYDLLQAISSTGMQFGEMNIFHYYSPNDEKKAILFSLASATKPGEFHLDRMGDFSCAGLTLFMDLKTVAHPEWVFHKMLHVAEQLAEDLDGELCAVPRRPWTIAVQQEYQERLCGM